MSYDDDAILQVPWCSDRWELAILRRPNISFVGGPHRWVLYRPERLLVSKRALENRRVRGALARADADRCDDDAVAVAQELGLELMRVAEDRVVALVSEINELVPCSASLNNVPMPGPHHIHGDDDPDPADDPRDIPGADGAGEGLRVLVLDTGYAAGSKTTLNVSGASGQEEVVDEDNDGLRDPAAGHGTHVSGIVARYAPGATIIPRRLLTSPVGEADDLEVAAALLQHDGAHIINCSFGEQTFQDEPPLAIQQALAALPASTVVVAASGNGGVATRNWPAAFDRVVAVGAVGLDDGVWKQTDFSNFGPWVDCCAPGVGIVSTFLTLPDEGFTQGFASWTGTSMASPMVAGRVAAMATGGGQGIDPGADLATRAMQAAQALEAMPPVGDVGAFVAPPSN